MKDNYDLPDIEMRGVPGMLIRASLENNERNQGTLKWWQKLKRGKTHFGGTNHWLELCDIRVHERYDMDDWEHVEDIMASGEVQSTVARRNL